MGVYHAVNLQGLPLPNVLKPLDVEAEVNRLREALGRLFPKDHPVHEALSLESEPLNKIIEILAYECVLKVEQINQAARALSLVFATGGDLDHIGVTYYRLERKLLQAEDLSVYPQKLAIYETDDDYRNRLALSIEATTKAGSAGAYEFHALSASSEVASVGLHSPAPCIVDVYLMGAIVGDILEQTGRVGVSDEAVNEVQNALSADDVRPLTDIVRVQSAQALTYRINATIFVKNGNTDSVLSNALADLRAYLLQNSKPANRIATSRIIGALDVAGVNRVVLTEPVSDILPNAGQVASCQGFDIKAVFE